MSARPHRIGVTITLLAVLPAIACLLPVNVPAHAREQPPQDAVDSTPGAKRPLSDVLHRLERSAGAVIVADSSIAATPVGLPTDEATPETLERLLGQITRSLPPGTTWGKLYVPTPKSGHFNGDDVAAYARAVARLVGKRVGTATPDGMVEILGQQLPEKDAQGHIKDLNLTLVYLVSNPGSAAALAPRAQALQDMVQQFHNMDSSGRVQMIAEMEMQRHAMMSAFMDGLTDEETTAIKRGMEQVFDNQKRAEANRKGKP